MFRGAVIALALLTASVAKAELEPPIDPLDDMWEVGVFGGLFLPARAHPFFEGTVTQRPLAGAMGDLGLRLAYFPLSYLGVEFEGAFMPGAAISEGPSVLMYEAGGHVILQVPWRLSFFLTAGGGVVGIASDSATELGSAVEPVFRWSSGVKFFVHDLVALRFEGRQLVSRALTRSGANAASHVELLLGLAFTLGRVEPDTDEDGVPDWKDRCRLEAGDDPNGCVYPDYDEDGVPDPMDQCPRIIGEASRNGCPPPEKPPTDEDGDGVPDTRDRCPGQKGVPPVGCPDRDADKDGVPIDRDKCPDEAGTLVDGCPVRDGDGDRIPDEADQCKAEAETPNGFKDEDGCPDTIPAEISALMCPLKGVAFIAGSRLAPTALKALDKVIELLNANPDIRIEVGARMIEDNLDDIENQQLSQARAESVKTHLVNKGILAARVVALGYGETRIGDNAAAEPVSDACDILSADPKKKGRRDWIELRLIR